MTTLKPSRASFSTSSGALLAIPYTHTAGESRIFDLNTTKSQDTVTDPTYLFSQLKSAEWLQRYGLNSQKLTFDQILQQIGFKRVEGFDASVKKNIGAKYAGSSYHEIQNDNGDLYVLTCRPEKLREYHQRLTRMLHLLRKRLAFISNGSRRVFGILGEPSICFVCDCKTPDHRIFNQFQAAVTNLLKEQVTKIKRFNIIWIASDNEQFQEKPTDVTSTSIDQAIDWISNRERAQTRISISATCEALLKAFTNPVHSIYLISEGNSSDSAREMLRDNIVKTRLSSNAPIPIHVVSLFCQDNDTETFLRSIAQTAGGSYLSYRIKTERMDMKAPLNLTDPTRIKVQDNKVQFGSNVSLPNYEQPIDMSLMYKEILQCENISDRLEKILGFVRDESDKSAQTTKSMDVVPTSNGMNKNGNSLQRSLLVQSSVLFDNDENNMASVDWLKIYGLEAQKLDFFTVLQSTAFRHCDGVVTLHKPPGDVEGRNDTAPADPKEKLVNAKYCDQFAHITWPDGTIRHVYVTAEFYRDYERKMRAFLEKIRARLLWLKKGSRDVFGTILEKNIYVLIDTSKSMENHIVFLKDKLRLLVQDQLFSKERFNMISFNSIINPWRDRLTKINDPMTKTQLQPWIDELTAEGSTNTLAALRCALADSGTEAIYLLTDGRPDQTERYVLSQVQYRQKVPIHTIAFNCYDSSANQFLFDLAQQTGGRFHAFNYGYENHSSVEIPESEDITYLKQALALANKDLQRVTELRDECMGRTWSTDTPQTRAKTPQLHSLSFNMPARSPTTLDYTLGSNSLTMPRALDSKKRSSASLSRKRSSKTTTRLFGQSNLINLNPDQWLLPESQEYLVTSDRKKKSPTTVVGEKQEEEVESTPPKQKIPTHYDKVKSYLKKNSLVCKGLTLLDVLHPTSITVKEPQHVQVIDRYVLAKVWDDLLPLVYGSHVNKFRLVNHYAVDLESYEIKLKDQLTEYHRFTSQFIWECLTDDEKRRLGPRLYWIALSNEEQYKYAQELTQKGDQNQNALELFVWGKLTDEERNRLLQKPAIYHEKTEVVLRNALKNDGADSCLEGVSRMDVEIKRGLKFLQISTDLRQHQKLAGNETKQKPETKLLSRRKSSTGKRMGQRVMSRYDGDGYFYPGSVQRNHDGQWIVLFDMGIEQDCVGHTLLPTNSSSNQLSLFLNDCVIVRQMSGNDEYWVPGLVLCLPLPYSSSGNVYTVQLYDPVEKQDYVQRKDMIRISVTLYQRSVLYLQNISKTSINFVYSGPNEPQLSPPSPQPSPPASSTDLSALIRDLIDPLIVKIDHVNESHEQRWQELQTTLEDHMGAIRILQEQRSKKPKVKGEFSQTISVQLPVEREYSPVISMRKPSLPDLSRSTSAITSSSTITTRPESPPFVSPRIHPGTRVHAVWSDDDGLVHEGTIVKSNGWNSYKVERTDFPGIYSDILLEDIFLDIKHIVLQDLAIGSFVLVKYPSISRRCFAPAIVLHHQTETRVRFYNCSEDSYNGNQTAIPISAKQFEKYTKLRIEKEKSLIGQVTVGLNKETNTFMLGTIKERIGYGDDYLVEWFNGRTNEQKGEHLLGVFTRRDNHHVHDYVLAIDENDSIYKAARVLSISRSTDERKDRRLEVEFLEDDRSTNRKADIPAITTFVITELYYNTIIRPRRE